MADIFDEVAPTGGGDIFDEVAKPQRRSLGSYLREEFTGGLKQAVQPSTGSFAGADAIAEKFPELRNMISSILGASRAAYSVPTAIGRKYVAEPLKELPNPTGLESYSPQQIEHMKQFAPDYYNTLAKLEAQTPEEKQARKESSAELMGSLAGAALSGGGTALVRNAPNFALRLAGKALDPLATAGPTRFQSVKDMLANRQSRISQATGEVATAEKAVQDLIAQQAAKKAEGQQAASVIEGALESAKRRKPILPEAPDVSGINLAETVTKAAPGKVEAGEQYGKVLTGTTKKLYRQSSQNYQNIAKQYGDEIVKPEALQPIVDEAMQLEGELRGVPVTKRVGMQIPGQEQGQLLDPTEKMTKWVEGGDKSFRNMPIEAINQLAELEKTGQLTVDTYRQVISNMLGGGEKALDVNKLIRLDQLLSEAGRSYTRSGNIAARSAVKQMQGAVDAALSQTGAAQALGEAKKFHASISELVGPESLSQKVFKLEPDQVVSNVFLPDAPGTKPNITMIRQAKKIYGEENPKAWQQLTGSALEQLQRSSMELDSKALDAQKFHRNWNRYSGTFKEALEPDQYGALQAIDDTISKYNIDRRKAAELIRENQATQRGLGEAAKRTKTQYVTESAAISEQLRGARANLGEKERAMKAIGEHKYIDVNPLMSPYTWLAVAQVGQALQASFTGNWAGVGRQLAQGVVWYTLGNPAYLTRVLSNPTLSKALTVMSATQTGVQKTLQTGRYAKILLEDIQQDMQQNPDLQKRPASVESLNNEIRAMR